MDFIKCGMMIDIIVLYILILLLLTLTLNQGHRTVRINLNGVWYTVETYFCDEPHTHFFSNQLNIQGKEPYLFDLLKKKKKKNSTGL